MAKILVLYHSMYGHVETTAGYPNPLRQHVGTDA